MLHLPRRERTLFNGRADAVYNRFVIEYEPPTSLQPSNTYGANKHAIDQVKQLHGWASRRIATRRNAWPARARRFAASSSSATATSAGTSTIPCRSTRTAPRPSCATCSRSPPSWPLTPENLVRDFGENSPVAAEAASRPLRRPGASTQPQGPHALRAMAAAVQRGLAATSRRLVAARRGRGWPTATASQGAPRPVSGSSSPSTPTTPPSSSCWRADRPTTT